jgi:hypothetical protein
MNSGAQISSDIVDAFNKLKAPFNHTLQAMLIEVTPEGTIKLAETLDKTKKYEDSIKLLPEDSPRILLTNLSFKHQDGRNMRKILAVLWSPDAADAQVKILYPPSFSAIKSAFPQIDKSKQATDITDIEFETIKEEFN